MVDPASGAVRVWLRHEKEWGLRSPVDARELLASGQASLMPPDGSGGDRKEAILISPDERRRRFAVLSKPDLQIACEAVGVAYFGDDARGALVEKLVGSGADPSQCEAAIAQVHADRAAKDAAAKQEAEEAEAKRRAEADAKAQAEANAKKAAETKAKAS